MAVRRELRSIAHDLAAGIEIEQVTVRTFLWWFGALRRGPNIVRRIRDELEEAGLVTDPDFEGSWVDAPITFLLTSQADNQSEAVSSQSDEPEPQQAHIEIEWVTRDATYRISKLAAANQQVVSITPDGTLDQAVTLLLARDFSQLPVMNNDRDVKGLVSWRSIGFQLAMGAGKGSVRDFMEPHHEVRAEVSIFDAIPIIRKHDYVLVRSKQNIITGIVTASDLSSQFQLLSEPFLLLSEIENLVRNMIGEKFLLSDLVTAQDPGGPQRQIDGVDDLTFGEYIRLLQNPERWSQLGISIDRILFCKDLDAVREIRNDVTHFDPDGITEADKEKLRDFKSLLERIDSIRS
jgi:predicted transcriptional regulator